MLSMGLEAFSLALYDDLPLVERLLDRYVEWIEVVAERACRLGFDVFVSTDDFAFNTATFFSPQVFRDLVLPRYRRVAPAITPAVGDPQRRRHRRAPRRPAGVGIVATHPNEPQATDIREMKRGTATGCACWATST